MADPRPALPPAELHTPTNPIRLVTASALFDGHDASINIMRRILMSQGCEVIHLGHNRSVQEVVDAALEEDVQGVAVSSYQGGHVEYFEYLVEYWHRPPGSLHITASRFRDVEQVYSPEYGVFVATHGFGLMPHETTIVELRWAGEASQNIDLSGNVTLRLPRRLAVEAGQDPVEELDHLDFRSQPPPDRAELEPDDAATDHQ